MVVVIFIVGARPRALEVPEQTGDFGVEATDVGRDSTPEPVGIAAVGDFECSDLGEEPCDDQGNRRWHDQSRWSAESGFSKGGQSGWNVAGLRLSKRFDCAYVTSEEGEHCYSDASLPWQSKERQLE